MTQRRRSNLTLPRDRGSMRLVHHTDAERKRACNRDSPVGQLDTARDEARAKGWTVAVDMAREWHAVYPREAVL
jgi:hypothetical protein